MMREQIAILITNKADLSYVGKERAFEVKCVQMDLKRGTIDSIIELEKHLKFNPWEEINDDERITKIKECKKTKS